MTEEQLIAAGWTRRNMGQSVCYTRNGEFIEVTGRWASLTSYTGRKPTYSSAYLNKTQRGPAFYLDQLGRMDWAGGKTVAQHCGVSP
jgi:hypothetical protein